MQPDSLTYSESNLKSAVAHETIDEELEAEEEDKSFSIRQ